MRELTQEEHERLSTFAEKMVYAPVLRAYAYADLSGQLPDVAECCEALEAIELHPDLRSSELHHQEPSVPDFAVRSTGLFTQALLDWADFLKLRRNNALPAIKSVQPPRQACGRCLWIRGAMEGLEAGRRAASLQDALRGEFSTPRVDLVAQHPERKHIERAVIEANRVEPFESLRDVAEWYRRWYLEEHDEVVDADVELMRGIFEYNADGDGGRQLVRRLLWRMDE